MAVLAHPDDESLGAGGTLAKYASEGVEVVVVTATRGDAGRFHGHRPGDPQHPGAAELAIRGLARDVAECFEPSDGWLQRHAANHCALA